MDNGKALIGLIKYLGYLFVQAMLVMPLMLAPLGKALIGPMKSLLSKETQQDAPESQTTVKVSPAAIAA